MYHIYLLCGSVADFLHNGAASSYRSGTFCTLHSISIYTNVDWVNRRPCVNRVHTQKRL